MSIYATLWHIRMPRDGFLALDEDEWVDVWAQAVPPHIGHPSHYPEGDPYGEFLPPVVEYDEAGERDLPDRAVVFCGPLTTKGTATHNQEYANPLLVMTGEEYRGLHWDELYERIARALRRQLGIERTAAVFIAPDGSRHRIVEDPPGE